MLRAQSQKAQTQICPSLPRWPSAGYLASLSHPGLEHDSLAAEFVSRLHFDVCFITGAGLTAGFGLSNGTDETASFQRAVIRNSRKKYLLIPSAKVGANSFIKVCDSNAFDAVITDWDCVEDQIAALEDKGVQVIVVDEPNE